MSDDRPKSVNGTSTTNNEGKDRPQELVHHVDATSIHSASTDTAPRLGQSAFTNGHAAACRENGKSDSEAETVVLSGKEEGTSRKRIKNEDGSDTDAKAVALTTRFEGRKESPVGDGQVETKKPSLKRKRVVQESATNEPPEAGNSSNLSSTFSSPVPQPQIDGDNEYHSDQPQTIGEVQKKKGRLRKRKLEREDDENSRQRRGKSDPSSGLLNGRERRGKRRVKDQDASSTRSESPTTIQYPRSQSITSSSIRNGVKRRKAPPSLSVERRRKASEDTHPESDDSTSAHSRPHLQKSASIDEHVMGKTSHKKILDKSGRTPVARACANDNLEQLATELKERPQHLNEPDYAENTPLQIAALGGFTDIVQYLLDEGCIVNCKNVDSDTPLIDAVENGHLEVVTQLLKAGADPRLRNGKGFEPLDLVNSENDEDGAIWEALLTAKEQDPQRRPSEDHAAGCRDNDGASVSASMGSPTDSAQGKGGPGSEPSRPAGRPSLGSEASRRKTARNQTSHERLLWISATPERLREAASKGDLEVVGHILNSRPADTESILVAARGGHEVVLQLLIALGRNPDPDPEPLQSSHYKPGHNTPMLAAIGGGNVKVVELLLKQSGFNPTRRVYRGYTYYELAKQRQSSNWQQEYDLLKEAFDNYAADTGRRSTHGSPRKIRTKRVDSSSSPHSEHRPDGLKQQFSHKALAQQQVRSDDERKDATAVASDREAGSLGPPKSKIKGMRSASDAGSTATSKIDVNARPRRRLMSKNEISDQDVKRRASQAVENSPSASHDKPRRKKSDASMTGTQDERNSHKSSSPVKQEAGKKRLRTSMSPRSSISEPGKLPGVIKKKKRRVDSGGNSIEQDQGEPPLQGPAVVANMIASPEPIVSPVSASGTAPVAFMGGNAAQSPKLRSPDDSKLSMKSLLSSIDRARQRDNPGRTSQSPQQSYHDSPKPSSPQGISPRSERSGDQASPTSADAAKKRNFSSKDAHDRKTSTSDDRERLQQTDREREDQVAKEQEAEATRQRQAEEARKQEEAHLKAQHEAEEITRQLQKEREEEEAREAQKRAQEYQARRLEQERQQREKEERRQAELEQREQIRRLRLQEEKEQQRRDSLPNGLRRAAELSPEEARDPEWINKWLPLYTVETEDLDPDGEREDAHERWVANIQVAPLLAIKDLELSQCMSFPFSPFDPTKGKKDES